jgi:L-2-amino-thiazoline-4-carboxylic acid hydrolase
MADKEELIPLKDAIQQVKTAATRLALIHLGFSKTLVEELGEKKAKKLIIKSMVKYGKLIGEEIRKGRQDLPYYGVHEKYLYDDHEYVDTRKCPLPNDEDFDFKRFKINGCMLTKIFRELGEEELGSLYCFVDSAKSMGSDPNQKLTHTACELLGDDCCSFEMTSTTEKEREDFKHNNEEWKETDPILAKRHGIEKSIGS